MTLLTYFGIGLLISIVVGVIGGIFWPESEEEREKRLMKKNRRKSTHVPSSTSYFYSSYWVKTEISVFSYFLKNFVLYFLDVYDYLFLDVYDYLCKQKR